MNKKDKILEFITSYIQEHGYSPSYVEIGKGVGLKSKSGVNKHVHEMLDAGILETDAEWASPRALRVPGYRFVKVSRDITNGDRIRAMSDEQLADFLNDMVIDDEGLINYCQNKKICEDKLDKDDIIPGEWCRQCILDWVRRDCSE